MHCSSTALGGVCSGGVSAPGGVCSGGVCSRGVSAPEGVVYPSMQWDRPPPPPLWTEFLTHAAENITLPQLRCGR